MSDYFPVVVVNDILKRLPVKSLLKFRCVCKKWCSLISSSDFITQHLSHSSSTNSRTLVRYYSKLDSKEKYIVYNDDNFDAQNSFNITFPFHEKSKCYYQVVGYCNGLLCLSDDLFRLRETKTFVIWNPSINRAVNVRPPRVIFEKSSKKCMFALGFGFDFLNNDYKIVRLAYFSIYNEGHHALPPYVEVFSLSKRAWRRVNNSVESYISDHCWSPAPFVHGAVHWVSFKMIRNNQVINRRHSNSILKFDLSTEEFSELGFPSALDYVQPIRMIAATVCGCLAIVHNDRWMDCIARDDWSDICVIWVMSEYNNVESWYLIFKIQMDTGFCTALHMNGSTIMFGGTIVAPCFYNIYSKVTKFTEICGTTFSFFVDKYVESLVLLENGKEVWGLDVDSGYEDENESAEENEILTLKSKTDIIFSFYFGEA